MQERCIKTTQILSTGNTRHLNSGLLFPTNKELKIILEMAKEWGNGDIYNSVNKKNKVRK